MKRLYEQILKKHLDENKQMIFIEGARQVGKTTLSKSLGSHAYMTWDSIKDRELILKGQEAVAEHIGLLKLRDRKPLIVFDELHKFQGWKTFLKGFYDVYGDQCQIIVTGSSKLGVYKKGGDSLMGRYFPYRIHPLTLAEASSFFPKNDETQLPKKPKKIAYDNLLKYGGFPDPFIKATPQFWNRWKRTREDQTFKEDIRELTQVQEISQMEVLAALIKEQSGQLLNKASLAKKIGVSIPTITRWLDVFSAFYYTFRITPWHKNVTRSLIKDPKLYFWDWSLIEDKGAKFENFIASHLLKFVHYKTDKGDGTYKLHFIRDKEKREVDFLVVKNDKPWFLLEAKLSDNQGLSKNLALFQEQLNCPHAFQVVNDMDFVNKDCFQETHPIIVPAMTFLSQLV